MAETDEVVEVAERKQPYSLNGATAIFLIVMWLIATGFGMFIIYAADTLPSHGLSVPTVMYAFAVLGLLRVTGKMTG